MKVNAIIIIRSEINVLQHVLENFNTKLFNQILSRSLSLCPLKG